MKRPKPLMHAKTTRRQQRYFGDLSPQDFARHDRKLADLRRADAVNDISLEVTARRLATVFPQEIDVEPYIAVVKAFLNRPENTIHKNRTRSKMQERHQKALRLLRETTLGGQGRAAYCAVQGIDLADANRMLAHLCSKDDELRCAVDFISAHGTGTSSQNRQPGVPAGYIIGEGSDSAGIVLTPAVRLAIKTPQGAKVLVFPNLRSVEFTGTSSQNRQVRDSAGYVIGEGKEPAATFTAQVGDCTWTLLCRDEPPKDWRGIEGVFEPGNETVTVGIGDDPWAELHTRGGSVSKGTFTSGTLATGGGDTIPHSEIGQQRPGDRWVRVGPRAVVEARRGGDKLQANTTTPPTHRVSPCECMTCSGFRWKWRLRWRGPDWCDCDTLAIHRDGRWRGRQWKSWLPWHVGVKVPADDRQGWVCNVFESECAPAPAPTFVLQAPYRQRGWSSSEVVNGVEVQRTSSGEMPCPKLEMAHRPKMQINEDCSEFLKGNPEEMQRALDRLPRDPCWHTWIAAITFQQFGT